MYCRLLSTDFLTFPETFVSAKFDNPNFGLILGCMFEADVAAELGRFWSILLALYLGEKRCGDGGGDCYVFRILF